MEIRNISWRAGLIVLLILGLAVATPLHQAAAQQRHGLPKPYVQQEQDTQERTSRGWWIIPAVIVGCLLFDCLKGSGGGQGSGSTPGGQNRLREEEHQRKRESLPAGDPPGTCFWGDTTMGTCVK
jgi:hypothetical protein